MFNPMQMFQGMQNANQRMQMFKGILNAKNPRQLMQNITTSGLQNNPMFQRAQQMAEGKSPRELQQIAANLCQQRGIDFNQAWQQFNSMLGKSR